MKELIKILYFFSGTLWAIELLPQLWKTYKRKTVGDISLFFPLKKIPAPWALAGLFVSLGAIMFWITPRSIDLAVVGDTTDHLMHFTLLLSGFALRLCLAGLPLLLKMATGIYVTSMAGSFGVILSQSTARICARFDITEQQETGIAMLWATVLFLIVHVIWSLRSLVMVGPEEETETENKINFARLN